MVTRVPPATGPYSGHTDVTLSVVMDAPVVMDAVAMVVVVTVVVTVVMVTASVATVALAVVAAAVDPWPVVNDFIVVDAAAVVLQIKVSKYAN